MAMGMAQPTQMMLMSGTPLQQQLPQPMAMIQPHGVAGMQQQQQQQQQQQHQQAPQAMMMQPGAMHQQVPQQQVGAGVVQFM
jgi:hypothetical protein